MDDLDKLKREFSQLSAWVRKLQRHSDRRQRILRLRTRWLEQQLLQAKKQLAKQKSAIVDIRRLQRSHNASIACLKSKQPTVSFMSRLTNLERQQREAENS